MSSAIRLTLPQARRAWLARQGLAPHHTPDARPLHELVSSIGWIPCPSGLTPYLALHARGALDDRSALDDALYVRRTLDLVPGPRGLTWLVSATDAPLARALAMADHTAREARLGAAASLTAGDVAHARDALRNALRTPRTPAQLRAVLPPSMLTPLPAAAKRVGFSTLAGLALRALWIQGEVTRRSPARRPEEPAVEYAIDPAPRSLPGGSDAVATLGPRWFAAHAPTSLTAFAESFDLAHGRAVSTLRTVLLIDVQVEGLAGPLLAPPDFEAPDAFDGPAVSLLPACDPWLDAHAALSSYAAIASPDAARVIARRHIGAAPAVVVDGAVAGTWSWQGGRVELRWIEPVTAAVVQATERASSRVAALLRSGFASAPLHDGRAPRSAPPLPGELLHEV